MHLKALPLFVSLVVGLAAPDPSPAPDADLVADLLERQITASAPGVGATVNSERYEWFKARFMSLGKVLNQDQPAFWQFSWSHRDSIPASEADARGMLQDKINAMLQSPEYQLF